MLYEALFLPNEWLHLTLLSLEDLGHGLIEDVAGGIHSPWRIFQALGSIPLGATLNGPLMAVDTVLEVSHPLVRTLVARRGQMRLHLNLDCPASRNPPLLIFFVFNYRILNNKFILELLN